MCRSLLHRFRALSHFVLSLQAQLHFGLRTHFDFVSELSMILFCIFALVQRHLWHLKPRLQMANNISKCCNFTKGKLEDPLRGEDLGIREVLLRDCIFIRTLLRWYIWLNTILQWNESALSHLKDSRDLKMGVHVWPQNIPSTTKYPDVSRGHGWGLDFSL